MADINITCHKCSKEIQVSEFVDSKHLKCPSCGSHLEKPGALVQAVKTKNSEPQTPSPTKSTGLRLAKNRIKETREDGNDKNQPPETQNKSLKDIISRPDTVAQPGSLELRPEVKVKKNKINHAIIAGILFLILGGVMGYLRYGDVLPKEYLNYSVEYAWIVFLAFHAMIVIKSMTDNIMQGILCLLVPGYSLFYLFSVSDDFYLRAIVAAMLIGIGQDAASGLKERAGIVAKITNDFIAGGGGSIR